SVISERLFSVTGDKIASKADGFALYFDNTSGVVSIRYCLHPGGANYDCSGVEVASPIPQDLGMIKFTTGGANCNGILFKRVTGDISAMSAASAVPNDSIPVCTITIDHVEAGRSRTINIDVSKNVIE
ncbi:hypothetical protein KC640_01280, partial [Candidatus Dojkabacteria bacterium]|nr:hypothetical protein [Candidatus Dojkabacteria bacterium]